MSHIYNEGWSDLDVYDESSAKNDYEEVKSEHKWCISQRIKEKSNCCKSIIKENDDLNNSVCCKTLNNDKSISMQSKIWVEEDKISLPQIQIVSPQQRNSSFVMIKSSKNYGQESPKNISYLNNGSMLYPFDQLSHLHGLNLNLNSRSISESRFETPKSSAPMLLHQKSYHRALNRWQSVNFNTQSIFSSIENQICKNLKTYDDYFDNSKKKQIKINYEEDLEESNFAKPLLRNEPA